MASTSLLASASSALASVRSSITAENTGHALVRIGSGIAVASVVAADYSGQALKWGLEKSKSYLSSAEELAKAERKRKRREKKKAEGGSGATGLEEVDEDDSDEDEVGEVVALTSSSGAGAIAVARPSVAVAGDGVEGAASASSGTAAAAPSTSLKSVKSALSWAKWASAGAAVGSAAVAAGVAAVATSVGTSMSTAIRESDYAKQVKANALASVKEGTSGTDGEGGAKGGGSGGSGGSGGGTPIPAPSAETIKSLKTVASAAVIAYGEVLRGAEEASAVFSGHATPAVKDLVAHRYGAETAEVAALGMSVAADVTTTAWNMKGASVKGVAKNAAKKAAIDLAKKTAGELQGDLLLTNAASAGGAAAAAASTSSTAAASAAAMGAVGLAVAGAGALNNYVSSAANLAHSHPSFFSSSRAPAPVPAPVPAPAAATAGVNNGIPMARLVGEPPSSQPSAFDLNALLASAPPAPTGPIVLSGRGGASPAASAVSAGARRL